MELWIIEGCEDFEPVEFVGIFEDEEYAREVLELIREWAEVNLDLKRNFCFENGDKKSKQDNDKIYRLIEEHRKLFPVSGFDATYGNYKNLYMHSVETTVRVKATE